MSGRHDKVRGDRMVRIIRCMNAARKERETADEKERERERERENDFEKSPSFYF